MDIIRFVAPAASPRDLARATLAGFVASVAMLITFGLAYAAAALLAQAGVLGALGLAPLRAWLSALTTNQVVDLARPNVYAAIALHLAAGLLWALLYPAIVEPRLSGPDWQRGLTFALIPWTWSLAVFLPLVGGGPFGLALGAGPLPILGNLALHAVYGVVLGDLYGPLGSVIDAEPGLYVLPERTSIAGAELGAARGLVLGSALGVAASAAGLLVAQASGDVAWTLSAAFPMMLGITVSGAALGAVLGSLVGLGVGGRS
jgi:hypothetical protein